MNMKNDTQRISNKPVSGSVFLLDVVIISIIFRTGK